ncbi:MAG: rhomboid family intramembrane serine protease [Thermodesulfobacteriota bacterium]
MIPIKDDQPTTTFPIVTIGIIALSFVVYIYQLSLGPYEREFIHRWGTIPYEFTHFQDIGPEAPLSIPFTIFSAMFMHGSILHLLGNMLYLWIFGDNLEDYLGRLRFILFYIAAGIAAALAQIILNVDSQIPMIGASGAIAGVLGGYALLFPRARVLTLFIFFFIPRLIHLPALFFLGIWFLFQMLSSGSGGGVAWFAHIGGFVAGILLVPFLQPHRWRRVRYLH